MSVKLTPAWSEHDRPICTMTQIELTYSLTSWPHTLPDAPPSAWLPLHLPVRHEPQQRLSICMTRVWEYAITFTSSSEPNRSKSSSSSSSSSPLEVGTEVEVASATPAGPYWPRGFFTPGRLTGDRRQSLPPAHTDTNWDRISPCPPVLLVLVRLDVIVPAKSMTQVSRGGIGDCLKDSHVSLRGNEPEGKDTARKLMCLLQKETVLHEAVSGDVHPHLL